MYLYEAFGPHEAIGLGFVFLLGGVMTTLTGRSSTEGLVTTSVGEDNETVAAVEHSATDVALSRSMHFRHGGSNPS